MPIIVVISDIHTGHPAAVWPKSFTTDKDNVILPNKAQKVLLQYWEDFWGQQDAKDAEYILNLEESVEGYSKKEHGRDIMVTDIHQQIQAFYELLFPYTQGKIYIGIEGSQYHGSEDMLVGKVVCEKFGGNYQGILVNWKVGDTGKIIHATHKSSGAMLYKATALDRNSLYMSAAKSKVGFDPDVMIYGHHHQYFRVDTMTRINVMAPTWKVWHPIKSGEKYAMTQPSIGGLIIKIGKRIEVEPYLYPLLHVYDALVKM